MTPISIKQIASQCIRIAMCGLVAVSVASCGGGGGSPGTVAGGGSTTALPGSVSLLFSSPELKSAGTPGSEVTVTALVKNADNNAVEGVAVQFTSDSGALVGVDSKTDKNGQAKATLTTSGDRSNRSITVNVKAADKTATGKVSVVGSKVVLAGPPSLALGDTGEFSITVRDSADVPIPNAAVTYASQNANAIAVKTSGGSSTGGALTNAQGQIILKVTASKAGSDVITASAQGMASTLAYAVNASNFTLKIGSQSAPATAVAKTSILTCMQISAHYDVAGAGQNGNLNLSTSRGKIYLDKACTAPLTSGKVSIVSGEAQSSFIQSDSAGLATVTGTVDGGPSTQASIEFSNPLTPTATVSVQPEPAVVGPGEQSVLTAIVRDGTAQNNLVQDAVVEFTILSDASGGTLSNPSTVRTGANGAATVSFVAGSATTATNGVTIQAKIQGTATAKTTTLTVAKSSLFVSAGVGNELKVPNTSTYQQDYVVLVTDSSGNPVKDVNVTASVRATVYRKGVYTFVPSTPSTASGWTPVVSATCANEDSNQDGILDAGEDINGNGRLEPGAPVNIAANSKTDASGTTIVSLLYPKDRSNWTDVVVTFRGSVAGTESVYTTSVYTLPMSSADSTNQNVSPPGSPSPYGIASSCSVAN
jgi:hypothetical protein